MLDGAGLRVVASHEGIERLRDDAEPSPIAWPSSDCPRVIVPWMPEADRRDRRRCPPLRRRARWILAALGRTGSRLGYHNHDFEFAPLDGTTIWDVLLAELPPRVELELDVYWAAVGGRDPVAEIGARSPTASGCST